MQNSQENSPIGQMPGELENIVMEFLDSQSRLNISTTSRDFRRRGVFRTQEVDTRTLIGANEMDLNIESKVLKVFTLRDLNLVVNNEQLKYVEEVYFVRVRGTRQNVDQFYYDSIPHIKKLHFYNSDVDFPDISQFPNLEELHLVNCLNREIYFEGSDSLKKLVIKWNRLNIVDLEGGLLDLFPNLEYLIIQVNDVMDVDDPESYGRLFSTKSGIHNNLKYFTFNVKNGTNFNFLRHSAGFPNLQYLDISYCRSVNTLPPNLDNLKVLNVNYSGINDIPVLNTLEYLGMSDTPITAIHELPNLKYLNTSYSDTTIIPLMYNLKYLVCNGHRRVIIHAPNLIYLKAFNFDLLDKNSLKYLIVTTPMTIGRLNPMVEYDLEEMTNLIYLEDNYKNSLYFNFPKSLEYLQVQNNNNSTLPNSLTNLKILYAPSKMLYIPSSYTNLKELQITDLSYTTIPSNLNIETLRVGLINPRSFIPFLKKLKYLYVKTSMEFFGLYDFFVIPTQEDLNLNELLIPEKDLPYLSSI